jgi:hypothetical protein
MYQRIFPRFYRLFQRSSSWIGRLQGESTQRYVRESHLAATSPESQKYSFVKKLMLTRESASRHICFLKRKCASAWKDGCYRVWLEMIRYLPHNFHVLPLFKITLVVILIQIKLKLESWVLAQCLELKVLNPPTNVQILGSAGFMFVSIHGEVSSIIY